MYVSSAAFESFKKNIHGISKQTRRNQIKEFPPNESKTRFSLVNSECKKSQTKLESNKQNKSELTKTKQKLEANKNTRKETTPQRGNNAPKTIPQPLRRGVFRVPRAVCRAGRHSGLGATTGALGSNLFFGLSLFLVLVCFTFFNGDCFFL